MRTNPSTPVEIASARPRSRRRWVLPILAVVVIAAVVGLAAFQPWKLFIDKRVDESLPSGASATASTIAASATTVPATVLATAAPTAAPTVANVSATTVASPAPVASTIATSPPTTAASTTASTEAAAAPVTEPAPTSFTSGEHTTTGTVRRLTVDSKTILRFEDLSTSNGPDVHVYLSPGADGYADGAINIATLKGNKGNQNYEIPDDVDLNKYRSVVIWCKRFSVAFGQAPLPGA